MYCIVPIYKDEPGRKAWRLSTDHKVREQRYIAEHGGLLDPFEIQRIQIFSTHSEHPSLWFGLSPYAGYRPDKMGSIWEYFGDENSNTQRIHVVEKRPAYRLYPDPPTIDDTIFPQTIETNPQIYAMKLDSIYSCYTLQELVLFIKRQSHVRWTYHGNTDGLVDMLIRDAL
jgi:hypothetical protein